LVYNINAATVDYVGDKRDQNSLEERQKVKAIAMDMWGPYIAATKAYIPEAEKKFTFDRYHVMRLVVDAVDNFVKE